MLILFNDSGTVHGASVYARLRPATAETVEGVSFVGVAGRAGRGYLAGVAGNPQRRTAHPLRG